jgi:glutaryl-CoA dehydrogenase
MADESADHVLPEDLYRFEELLVPREAEVLQRVREFLAKEVAPHADEWWGRAEFPRAMIPRYAQLGIAGLRYPECAEETVSSLLSGFIALEMGRVDASMATFYGVHSGLAMGSIARCGSAEQRRRWLPEMGRMERIGAFALTEPHGGSDVAAGMHTTARREGDTWILDGAKRWIGNATFADLTIVWAADREDGGVHGFVVPAGTPGFTATKIENKMALRTVENADIVLEGCRVPEENRLAQADSFRDTAAVLRQTRSGVAWEAVGVMLGAYKIARDYAVEREQFGGPLARFQLVQHNLVRMMGNVTACLGMVVRLAQLEESGRYADGQSSLAKTYCAARMRESVAWGREILGGNGIVLDYGIGRMFADAEALYSYEGTHEINTLITGRALTGISAFV